MRQNKTACPPVRLVSDHPATENLVFGFDAYAATLAALIAGKTNTTPLALGIHGDRGAGKTTLMKAIKSRLDGDTLNDAMYYRRCKTVWFQAWKYNDRDAILTALIEALFTAMAADGFFSLARAKVDTVTRRFDKSSIFASISKLAAGVDISDFFSGAAFGEELGFSETFQRFFDDLVWTFLNWRFKLSGQEKPDDRMGAVVIFIDDLDRCRPDRIVQILEAITLYMNRSGCIFVIGAESEVLHGALAAAYGSREGGGLLEKIIPAGFTIPKILPEDFVRLIEAADMDASNARTLSAHLSIILSALEYNPRRFKRLINGLNLLCGLLAEVKVQIGFDKVLAWWMVTRLFGDLSVDVKDGFQRLAALREASGLLAEKYPQIPAWQLSPEQFAALNIPESLYPCLQCEHLAEIVIELDLTDRQFRCLSALGGSVGLPGNQQLKALTV